MKQGIANHYRAIIAMPWHPRHIFREESTRSESARQCLFSLPYAAPFRLSFSFAAARAASFAACSWV
jgi:hypothetical protein